MTKKQLQIAIDRHARGERWYDGPELFNAITDGAVMGIGTREELDALKADGILAANTAYSSVTPQDIA